MSQFDFGGPLVGWQADPSAGQHGRHEYDEYGEYLGYRESGASDDFAGRASSPGRTFAPVSSYEFAPAAGLGEWPYDEPGQLTPPQSAAPSVPPLPGQSAPYQVRPPRRRTRWLGPVAVVAVGAATCVSVVLLNGGLSPSAGRSPGVQAAPSAPGATAIPPAGGSAAKPRVTARARARNGTGGGAAPSAVTLTQARQVLTNYTAANNRANSSMSATMLAGVETGSSFAIDSGVYRQQQAERAAPFQAFGPRQAEFYIPRQSPAAYPHWFVVQVANAGLAGTANSTGSTQYVVFTQAAPGAPWLNTVEPYVLSGVVMPRIATGADGLATPVGPAADSLAVAPDQIATLTAAALDAGAGGGGLASPPNLADRLDQVFWQQKVPSATVTDHHSTVPGASMFGLETADGGALLFYAVAAELTITPPPGQFLHLAIPGFYSSGPALRTAEIGYLEQFSTYVPPRGGSGLRVIADNSGITARLLLPETVRGFANANPVRAL